MSLRICNRHCRCSSAQTSETWVAGSDTHLVPPPANCLERVQSYNVEVVTSKLLPLSLPLEGVLLDLAEFLSFTSWVKDWE
jgi:hypothetical protein